MFKRTTNTLPLLAGGLIWFLVAAGCVQPQSSLTLPLEAPNSLLAQLEQLPPGEPADLPPVPPMSEPSENLAPVIDADALDGLRARLVERGQNAFENACTQCHEASQALTVRKSFDEWIETINEMVGYAEEDDVDLDRTELRPIAAFLASRTDAEIEALKASADNETVADEKETDANATAREINRGHAAFIYSCLECHDAERSLAAKKSYDGWMSTIRRMAKKEDANIDSQDMSPIARFLTSRSDAEIEDAKLRAEKKALEDDREEETANQDKAEESSGSSVDLAAKGEVAFYKSCIKCHNADRSLTAEKPFDEWMSPIRRMARKEDAEIDSGDFRAIATFLSERTTEEVQEAKASAEPDEQEDADTETGKSEPDTGRKFDPSLVASGRTAFNKSCLKCHDAQRSLSKKKGLAAWRATVKRMAAKDGANVRPGDIESISVYLASESAGGGGDIPDDAGGEVSPWTFSSTISTLHRTSSDPIENPGFFVDAWVGADWQSDGPLRATVMACTSCHSDRNSSKGFTLELVEASATIDLKKLFTEKHQKTTKRSLAQAEQMQAAMTAHGGMNGQDDMLQLNAPENAHTNAATGMATTSAPLATSAETISTSADLKMGRFVVPFGAYSAFSHPGSYRTITNPLMFNMGRRLDTGGPFQPVLPAPYSDEGVNLRLALREYCDRSYTLDLFAINGLQGTAGGANFNLSRSYTDNNRVPAVGGRYTLGNQIFRLGVSGMLGQMQNDGSDELDYHLIGADALVNTEFFRAYVEYAFRREEAGIANNEIDGYIVELEWKLLERLGFLTRYDTLEHDIASAGEQSIDRFTWGLNFTFQRAGLLLLNHEHWMLDDRSDVDVIGARWVTTF